jgi:transglutaminase-like putative cysteine protease
MAAWCLTGTWPMPVSRTFARIVQVALLVLLCLFSLGELWDDTYSMQLVDPKKYNTAQTWSSLDSLYSNYGVVRILDEATIDVSSSGRVVWLMHTLDAVLDPYRAEAYKFGTLPYSSAFGAKLVEFQARTINEDGRISDVGSSDQAVHPAIEQYILYSDYKELSYSFPDVKKHSLLETACTFSMSAPFWRYVHLIGYIDAPTIRSSFVLSFPGRVGPEAQKEEWSAEYRTYGPVPKPVESFDRGKTKLVWALDSIPAITAETYLPPNDYWHSRIAVTPAGKMANARDFGAWYWKELLAERIAPSENLRRKAAELVTGHDSEREKVKALYEYVQKTRYVAIFLGNGGWQPHFVDEIDGAGYGDCKDKAALLVSLLRAVGVSAYPALVLTSQYGRVEKDLFDPAHSNHMIVFVKGSERSYWLDPTARHCPFDFMPYESVTAMVLKEDGGYVTETSSDASEGSEYTSHVSTQLTGEETIIAVVRERLKFPASMWERGACAEAGLVDVKKSYKDRWSKLNPGAKIDSLELSGVDRPDSMFSVAYRVNIPRSGKESGGRISVPSERLMVPRFLPSFGALERKHPIWISGYYGFEDTLEVADSTQSLAVEPKEDARFEGLPGVFEAKTIRSGERLLFVRKLVLRKKYFEPQDYGAVRSFFDNVRLHLRRYRLNARTG